MLNVMPLEYSRQSGEISLRELDEFLDDEILPKDSKYHRNDLKAIT